MSLITFDDIKRNAEIRTYIEMCDVQLKERGFTEHGIRHAGFVGERAGKILEQLQYPQRDAELARIAGFMHDIGNVVNRNGHENSGAVLAMKLLDKSGMDSKEICIIVSAIGNHDESTGTAVSPVSAALILSDKTDVHRARVRNDDFATFDIHDRVNYAVTKAETVIDAKSKIITLELTTDPEICPLIEYFEIFLARMLMCRRAASYLECGFKMRVNGTNIL